MNTFFEQYSFIDLTYELNEKIPIWPGSTPFTKELRCDYSNGCRVYNYHQAQGIGTHMDAPSHFIPNGRTISDFKLEEHIAPACVIDVSQSVNNNPDYHITAQDIKKWEQHQRDPDTISRAYLKCIQNDPNAIRDLVNR